MTLEEIRKNAPDGAEYHDGDEYWRFYNDLWWVYIEHYKIWERAQPCINDLVSIK